MPAGKIIDTAADFPYGNFSTFARMSPRSAFQTPGFSAAAATTRRISSGDDLSVPRTSIFLNAKNSDAVAVLYPERPKKANPPKRRQIIINGRTKRPNVRFTALFRARVVALLRLSFTDEALFFALVFLFFDIFRENNSGRCLFAIYVFKYLVRQPRDGSCT